MDRNGSHKRLLILATPCVGNGAVIPNQIEFFCLFLLGGQEVEIKLFVGAILRERVNLRLVADGADDAVEQIEAGHVGGSVIGATDVPFPGAMQAAV